MATIPQQDPTQAGATGAPDQDQGKQEATPVTVIEVSLMSDGTITVEQESGSQEEGEEGGSGSGEDTGEGQPTTVKDADEAGALVTQILQSAGQSPEDQVTANKAAQSQGYAQS